MRGWLVACVVLGACGGADVCELAIGQDVTLEWTLPPDLDSIRDRFPQLMTVERVEPYDPRYGQGPGFNYTLRTSTGSSMDVTLHTDTCDVDFGAALCNGALNCYTNVYGRLIWTGEAWAGETVQIRAGGPPYYSGGLVVKPGH
jgi:hypothetical protein